MAVQASLVNAKIAGYEVVGLIGRGATGTVYLARDVALDRCVALKVLLGNVARDPTLVNRFYREAQAAAPLRHPNLVRVYTAGIENGTPYIAMEYIEGEPLDRFLRRKGRLEWPNALHIAAQVAQALAYAHERGVVHRDVKPANIMLDRAGRVLLTDFGLANVQANGADATTDAGLLGTPQYMSPEQCAGRPATPASDLFSLGVTLYQMLAARLPFEGDSAVELIRSISSDNPPRLNRVNRNIPDDVARLAAHLLEKDPASRPASARAVAEAIARLQAEQGGRSAMPAALAEFIKAQAQPQEPKCLAPKRRPRRKPRAKKPRPRRFRRAAVTAVSLAFLCAGAGAFIWGFVYAATPDTAPRIDAVTFAQGPHSTLLAQFELPGLRFDDVSWIGGRSVALIEAAGVPGAITQDATGLLAVDPESRVALSVRPPICPAMDADFWERHVRVAGYAPVPETPPNTPLHDAVLIPWLETHARRNHRVALRAQIWHEATPRWAVLFAGPVENWNADCAPPWAPNRVARAVASPNGHTICFVLYEPSRQGNYLVERDVRWRAAQRVGPRLTTVGAPIIPRSVCYSPDGAQIAYVRDDGENRRELWVVASDGAEVNGRPLALGALGAMAAFSPDATLVAFNVTGEPSGEPEVAVVHAADGKTAARPGHGILGSQPWHPSGRFLVVAAREDGDDNGPTKRQLWAVDVDPPYSRRRLTKLPAGVRTGGACSRNAQWAAAITNEDTPGLVFVNLEET